MTSRVRIAPNDPVAGRSVQELYAKPCGDLCWRRPKYNCARCKWIRRRNQAKQGPARPFAPPRAEHAFRSIANARMRAMHMAIEVGRSQATCVHVVLDESRALIYDAREVNVDYCTKDGHLRNKPTATVEWPVFLAQYGPDLDGIEFSTSGTVPPPHMPLRRMV